MQFINECKKNEIITLKEKRFSANGTMCFQNFCLLLCEMFQCVCVCENKRFFRRTLCRFRYMLNV